jgi:hypothetical protein
MSENKKDAGLDGREILGIGALCLGAFWYKYGHSIEVWFHENLVEVVFIGAAALTLCGYIMMRRFQKKNEEEISRIRRLNQARPPGKSRDSYYQRRDGRDFDHE